MKTIFSCLSVSVALLLTLSVPVLKAQQFYDEKPTFPLKGTWYIENPNGEDVTNRSVDPFIVSCIGQISPDSIRATIAHMENYGTRFMLRENRKEIATWILKKFQSYGYIDVKLDSFLNITSWNGAPPDTTWQYNVVCTMNGLSAPEEEYIVGGHYDSYCSPDPMIAAPGADDNSTAVAATLEIARVMKKMNYNPEATIKFILFAAEELGLLGSRYDAQVARESGRDIRYMLNMDMISNNPDSLKEVKIYKYIYFEWAADLMADVFQRYTDLDVFFPDEDAATGSDSYSYWMWGFPSAYLEEMDFSPNWHKLSDTIGNCNIEYCAEIARGAFATLVEQQKTPYPLGLAAESLKENITLTWESTANANVIGFNLYRSEVSGSGYSKLNSSPVADTVFIDNDVVGGNEYYYILKTVNDSLHESIPSAEVNAARFSFTDTLLVVACLKDSKTTPDSIINYYRSVLDTIPFVWQDMNLDKPLKLGTLARYQNILWLINNQDFNYPSDTLGQKLVSFFSNGGNMMFSGFTPSRYFAQNSAYPNKFDTNYFINRYFKVDSVNRKINSFMYRAYPVAADYDTLNVDPVKWMEPTYPGEIYNIEVVTPGQDAMVIYRFDSHYQSNTPLGMMQDKAVGLEYLGDDFRTILLSFPLYYMDTLDARKLMKTVMKYKFTHPVGIAEQPQPTDNLIFRTYPNPFRDIITLSFRIGETTGTTLQIYNMQGVLICTLLDRKLDPGIHTVELMGNDLPSGIYQLILKTKSAVSAKKIVLIK